MGDYFPSPYFATSYFPDGFFGPVESVVEPPAFVPGGGGGSTGYETGDGLTHHRRVPRPPQDDTDRPVEIAARQVRGKVFVPALEIAGVITLGATISGVTFVPRLAIVGGIQHSRPPPRATALDLENILAVSAAADIADVADDVADIDEIAGLIDDLDEVL